ncbi:MAG: STAS domain-containing protein [Myxococcales bacterium]
MEPLQHETLTIHIEHQPGALIARWKGKSASREPGKVLTPWFDQLLQEASDRGARLQMHFEALEHFNSSTIAALIQLMNRARHEGVALTLVYDAGQKWQSLSFDALQRAVRVFDSSGGPGVQFMTSERR